MKAPYLEVTFRKGKPLAAYLYLPREVGAKSVRTESAASGLLVDFSKSGKPIGIEITAPGKITAEQVNAVLVRLGLPRLDPEELQPLEAA